MRIISHRGNLTGPDKIRENKELALIEALEKGFDIEFDIWYVAGRFWLGHDTAEISFSVDTLIHWSSKYMDRMFYVHCKNLWALEELSYISKNNIIPFCHDMDQAILLKDNTIWIHPNALSNSSKRDKSIAVFSTCKTAKYDVSLDIDFSDFYGICTDYPIDLRNSL